MNTTADSSHQKTGYAGGGLSALSVGGVSRDREARRKHALGGLTSQCACAQQAIQKLNDLYAKQKDAEALRRLLTELRPLFAVIPKAKTAKIVRTIIETIAKVPDSTQLQVRGPDLQACARALHDMAGHEVAHVVFACERPLQIDP